MDDSSERSTVYSTSTETILHALSTTYSSRLPERAASLADSGVGERDLCECMQMCVLLWMWES